MSRGEKLIKLLQSPNIWIGDTGASADSTPSKIGMTDMVKDFSVTKMGIGKGIESAGSGKLKVKMVDKKGKEKETVTMNDVSYIPKSNFNLFSLTKRMMNGYTLSGDINGIKLRKDNVEIVFDIVIKTNKGVLFCTRLDRINYENMEIGSAAINRLRNDEGVMKMNINKAHQLFGHMDERKTRDIAAQLDIEVTRGSFQPCESCAKAKAKQKNVPKKSEHE